MKITEIGCAGHFISSDSCRFRRHTQVGTKYRVSTVGDLYYRSEPNTRQTVGAGKKDFFETFVFKTNGKPSAGSEGCGCMTVVDWSEVEGVRWETAGEAQKGHEAMVRKYAKKAQKAKS